MARTGNDVVLVRHGETEWSLSGQHTGTTDIPLTEEGRRQAQLVGERLAGREFALVLTSPLDRAQETCRLSGLGDQAQVRDDLREWEYGAYEGVTTRGIHAQNPGWDLFDDGCPGGEDAMQVCARADRIVAELRAAGGDAAVFAHGHLLRVLCARWLELAPREARRFALSTATVSVLGFEQDWPAVWLWNDGSHLGAAP